MPRFNKKNLLLSISTLFFIGLILSLSTIALAREEVPPTVPPQTPSVVRIDNGQLMVQRRLSDGSLDNPKPYIIKGVTWSAATEAETFFTTDPDGLENWMRSQLFAHRKKDLLLMKEIGVNTVRTYIDFGTDPTVIKEILDGFYWNNIMVILTVSSSREEMDKDSFDVYSDYAASYNHFIPSGWMGNTSTLTVNELEQGSPASGLTCTKINFNLPVGGFPYWAGIFWQNTEYNWGERPGINLEGFNKLVFKARGEYDGQILEKVQFGGITGDTAKIEIMHLELKKDWQEYSINLSGKDLTNIRGGFCVVFERSHGRNQTIYLDDIYLTYDPTIGGPRKTAWYERIVELCKNHPAILMWSLGNEWNLDYNKMWGYETVADAADAVNVAAADIKRIDTNHPVSSPLGDRFDDPEFSDTVASILAKCPNVDLWGLNIYRGPSFNNLFNQWKDLTNKPFYFSEFGTDSYRTSSYTEAVNGIPTAGGFQAANCIGSEDEAMQKDFDMRLWEEIKIHLAPIYPGEQCVGGLVHEFNDEVWKVGNYNVSLGGLVDYGSDHSYDDYNPEGFVLASHPDGVANEEYFGVVRADRSRKQVFSELKNIYAPINGTIDVRSLEGNSIYTKRPSVFLNLSAKTMLNKDGIGFKMQFSNDNATWSTLEPYTTRRRWPLASGDGVKTMYVRFIDITGEQAQASDTIILDTVRPYMEDYSIISTAKEYEPIIFSATVTDTGSGIDKDKVFLCWYRPIPLHMGFVNEQTLVMEEEISSRDGHRGVYKVKLSPDTLWRGKIKYYITVCDKAGNCRVTPRYTISIKRVMRP